MDHGHSTEPIICRAERRKSGCVVTTQNDDTWYMAFCRSGGWLAGDDLVQSAGMLSAAGDWVDLVRFLKLLQCDSVVEKGHSHITTVHDLCPRHESILS
jgi:hypothetical protein